jgi:V/A-type H+-transporting ATPase subunit K
MRRKYMASIKKSFWRRLFLSHLFLTVVLFSTGIPAVTNIIAQTNESASTAQATPPGVNLGALGLIAAGFAFGLGALGAGIAIGNIGAAAMGAISEKPEIAANALIFIALAEGIMIMGFIIAVIILGKV